MSRSFIWSLIISALLFLITAIFYLIPPFNNPDINSYRLAGTIVYEIALLFSGILVFYGLGGMEKKWKGRLAWLLVLLALGSYIIGDTIWNVYDILSIEPPYPGVSDIFYILFYPLLILAMIRFMRVADVKPTPTETLLISILAALLVAEALGRVVIPNLMGTESPLIVRILDSFYPLADVAVLSIGFVILAQFWGGKVSVTYILFLVGIFVLAVTDAIYAFVSEDFGLNNPLDLGWMISYFLIGLAAVYERSLHEHMRKGVYET